MNVGQRYVDHWWQRQQGPAGISADGYSAWQEGSSVSISVCRDARRHMARARWRRRITVLTALLALAACGGEGGTQKSTVTPSSGARASRDVRDNRTVAPAGERRAGVGFHSRRQLGEHFGKHGADFAPMTVQEYLRAAQALRDAPVGGAIEEIRRPDGTTSRYDRATGAFIAFNADGTIRTFFKPNNGEAYFRRQAQRLH